MKSNLEIIKEKVIEVVPEILELKDGTLVQFESYSYYTNEGGSEEFSNEPDNFNMGIFLKGKVYGEGMASDYQLSTDDFKNGKWTTGIDENGGIDVWEYCKAEIIGRPIQLSDVLRAIENLICKDCKGQGGGLISGGYSECNNCGGDKYDLPEDLIGSGFQLEDVINIWDLSKPLEEQSEEVLEFLVRLLDNK